MLEALCHERSSFCTLTYDDQHVPDGGSLCPSELTAWLKRFRKRVYPRRVRYFAVGEYGDRSSRPHYHVALFGFGCEFAPVYLGGCQCLTCTAVRETWGFGHILVASLTEKSARYVSGYVSKSMTHPDDVRLLGRHPEFARMSLRPGIGADAMEPVVDALVRHGLDRKLSDVPFLLRHNRNLLPLGRYLRQQLRKRLGRDPKAPQLVSLQEDALSVVRAFAWNSERSVSSVFAELNPQRPYIERGSI